MDSEWLRAQFRLHPDKTKAGLAQALGLEAPAVSKILAGTRQIKAQEYIAMRRYFGLPVDGEKAARGGAHPAAYTLSPLAPGLKDGEAAMDENAWVMPASLFAARTRAPPDKIRIFPVQENAMQPDFNPGEHVLVDLSDQKPSPPGVFVVSDGMGYIIRQCEYLPHSKPAHVRLSARNPRYDPAVVELPRAGIVGRVIAKLEWL